MIYVRLKGGMGNQMFQYAFAKATAHKLQTDFKMDCSLLLDRARGEDTIYRDYDLEIFNVSKNFVIMPGTLRSIYKIKFSKIGKVLRQQAGKGVVYYKEPHFHLDKSVLEHPSDHTLYDGWWQAPAYFNEISQEIRKDFQFKKAVIESSGELLKKILNTASVCLNVRRTDFLTNPALNATNEDYFEKAVDHIKESVDSPHIFVFSDDMNWCQSNLKFDVPCTFVGHEHKGWKFGNYLQLMSACKYFIIPNSSFAWWAAWLSNKEEQIVVAPKNWFALEGLSASDLVPEGWVRV